MSLSCACTACNSPLLLESVTQIFNGRQQRRDVLALRLRLANLLGTAIALALQLLGLDLQRFAPFFKRQVGVGVKLEATPRQIGGNVGCDCRSSLGSIIVFCYCVYSRFRISSSFSRILISSPRGTG